MISKKIEITKVENQDQDQKFHSFDTNAAKMNTIFSFGPFSR